MTCPPSIGSLSSGLGVLGNLRGSVLSRGLLSSHKGLLPVFLLLCPFGKDVNKKPSNGNLTEHLVRNSKKA